MYPSETDTQKIQKAALSRFKAIFPILKGSIISIDLGVLSILLPSHRDARVVAFCKQDLLRRAKICLGIYCLSCYQSDKWLFDYSDFDYSENQIDSDYEDGIMIAAAPERQSVTSHDIKEPPRIGEIATRLNLEVEVVRSMLLGWQIPVFRVGEELFTTPDGLSAFAQALKNAVLEEDGVKVQSSQNSTSVATTEADLLPLPPASSDQPQPEVPAEPASKASKTSRASKKTDPCLPENFVAASSYKETINRAIATLSPRQQKSALASLAAETPSPRWNNFLKQIAQKMATTRRSSEETYKRLTEEVRKLYAKADSASATVEETPETA